MHINVNKIEQTSLIISLRLITYYVYFLHFAEFWLFTFNIPERHVTGLQLSNNFVYIINTYVA